MLSDRTVSDLRVVAIEGLTALPRRGLEVGGVLLGEVRGVDLHIEAFEQMPCEHRYGPSFTLSADDLEKLSNMMKKDHGGVLRAVGFFRSFTGRDPVIEEADQALVREHFPYGEAVYLMLQPLSVEKCVASYRFFRDGELLAETPEPPFAFDPQRRPAIGQAEEQEPEQPPLPAPSLPAPSLPPPSLPPPSLPPPHRAREAAQASPRSDAPAWAAEPAPRRSRLWISVLACLVVGVVGGAIYEWDGATRRPEVAQSKPDVHTAIGQVAPDAHPPNGQVVGDPVGPAAIPAQNSEADRTVPPPPAPEPELHAAVPPSAVHEVQPRVPEGIRSRITGAVIIPVAVQVNDRGRVVQAAAERQPGDGVHRYLADLAQKTAREWRFTPARTRSGHPVAAGQTIRFVFTP